MDPAARAVLERAVQTYSGASGIRYDLAVIRDGRVRSRDSVCYSRPNQVRIESKRGGKTWMVLNDGRDLYRVTGDQGTVERPSPYVVNPLPDFALSGTTGVLIAPMMEGKNPIDVLREPYRNSPYLEAECHTMALGAHVVDGEVLQGIRDTLSYRGRGTVAPVTRVEITAWFGGTPFALRRVQSRLTQGEQTTTVSEKILVQEISPHFPQGTFVFNGAGLEVVNARDRVSPPPLRVGATPPRLAAQDLEGQPVALEAYRGRVVLLDFWATWCPPCVKGVPELKRVYDKYHAKGLEVVGISLDEDKSKLAAFIAKHKLPWPQIFDSKRRISASYPVEGIPFLVLVARDGKIAAVNPRGSLEKAVKAALAIR